MKIKDWKLLMIEDLIRFSMEVEKFGKESMDLTEIRWEADFVEWRERKAFQREHEG